MISAYHNVVSLSFLARFWLLTDEHTENRFKQLKEEENKKKPNKALPAEDVQVLASTSDAGDISDGKSKDKVCWSI